MSAHPSRYGRLTLPALCAEMHAPTAELTSLLRAAPRLPGRTAAVMVATTPPGSPLLVPGEQLGPADSPLLAYLTALESFDHRFPGFASETHGVEHDPAGGYGIQCVLP